MTEKSQVSQYEHVTSTDLRMTSYECGHSNFFFSLIFLKIRPHYRAANSVRSYKCGLISRKPEIEKLMKIENEKMYAAAADFVLAHTRTPLPLPQLSPLWLWSLWIIPYGIRIQLLSLSPFALAHQHE